MRFSVADPARLDRAAPAVAGVQGVMDLPDGVLHLLLGLNADQYAAELHAALAG